jgi:hypothetical protein
MPPAEATRLHTPTSTHAILQAAKSFSPRFSPQGCQSSCPILFRLALHRRGIRVLHLQPVGRPPRPIARAEPLADDASRPSLQAWRKTRFPSSCSRCSLSRKPEPALARTSSRRRPIRARHCRDVLNKRKHTHPHVFRSVNYPESRTPPGRPGGTRPSGVRNSSSLLPKGVRDAGSLSMPPVRRLLDL